LILDEWRAASVANLKHTLKLALVFTFICFGSARVASAQRVKTAGARRIVSRSTVPYPKIASQMRLQGTVKIIATVAPSGKVVKTELIGGSPIFVPYALDAATLMRWQPAATETKEVLEVEFFPAERQ
jgi:outer membrane biosynthesis protein TonB